MDETPNKPQSLMFKRLEGFRSFFHANILCNIKLETKFNAKLMR